MILLERSLDKKKLAKLQGEYSIKLNDDRFDDNNDGGAADIRGLMVIKQTRQTRAKQRKQATSAWKVFLVLSHFFASPSCLSTLASGSKSPGLATTSRNREDALRPTQRRSHYRISPTFGRCWQPSATVPDETPGQPPGIRVNDTRPANTVVVYR